MSSYSDRKTLEPYCPQVHGPWHGQHAYHLLERAGFGGTPEDVRLLSEHGMEASVDFLLRAPSNSYLAAPDWASSWREERYTSYSSRTEEEKRIFRQTRSRHMQDVQRDWIQRMISGPQPFIEKLTLFFHSHFAVSADKIKDPLMFHEHLNLFREMGMGDFRELVKAVCRNPAMVIFLDSASNVKGRPNENFARELMELYTLGEGNGYSEQDVMEAARALTGWRVRQFQSEFELSRHDQGIKNVLGQKGNLKMNGVVDAIFHRPEAARFLAVKLFEFFVFQNPPEALCRELAQQFEDVNYQVREYLRILFSSEVFYSEQAYRSLVKSPVQLLAGTYRKLSFAPQPPLNSARVALKLMGQNLLWPPDVDGWKEGDVWVNTNALMMRYHWLHFLTTGEVPAGLKQAVKGETPDTYIDVAPFRIPGKPQDAAGSITLAALHLFGRPLEDRATSRLRTYLTRGSNNARVLFDLTKSTSEQRFRGILYLMMSSPDYQRF